MNSLQEQNSDRDSFQISLNLREDQIASELTDKQHSFLESRQVNSETLLSQSQTRVSELQSVTDEQNRNIQRQTAEKNTFSSQMKSTLEENSAEDALLASLNPRTYKLTSEIMEEKDESIAFQRELDAALSDNAKAIEEIKRLGQELRKTEEEYENPEDRDRQRQKKTLSMEKSLVCQHQVTWPPALVTSPSLEAEQDHSNSLAAKLEVMLSKSQATIREQEEQISQLRDSLQKEASGRQALMEEQHSVKAQLSDLLDRVKAEANVESSPQLLELKKQLCEKNLALEKTWTSLKSQRAYFQKLQTKNQTKISKLKATVEDLQTILRLRFADMHDLTVQNKTLWTEGQLMLVRNQKLEEKYELLLVDHRYLQAVLDTNHKPDLNTSPKAQGAYFEMLLSDNQSKLADCQKSVDCLKKILKTLQSTNHTLQASINSLETDHHILLRKYNALLNDKLQSVNHGDDQSG